MKNSSPTLLLFILTIVSTSLAQQPTDAIRLNQTGYYPGGQKIAVAVNAPGGTFTITRKGSEKILFRGKLGAPKHSTYNPVTTRTADFSAFSDTGIFVIRTATAVSHPFRISSTVNQQLLKAVTKSYYFQRFSIPLEEQFAGKWSKIGRAHV